MSAGTVSSKEAVIGRGRATFLKPEKASKILREATAGSSYDHAICNSHLSWSKAHHLLLHLVSLWARNIIYRFSRFLHCGLTAQLWLTWR